MNKRLFTMFGTAGTHQPYTVRLRRCRNAHSASPAAEAPAATDAPAAQPPSDEAPMKYAFFVSDLSNVFHQGQFTEAKNMPRRSTVRTYTCSTASRIRRP